MFTLLCRVPSIAPSVKMYRNRHDGSRGQELWLGANGRRTVRTRCTDLEREGQGLQASPGRILVPADQGGGAPARTDLKVTSALTLTSRTVEQAPWRFVEKSGVEPALQAKQASLRPFHGWRVGGPNVLPWSAPAHQTVRSDGPCGCGPKRVVEMGHAESLS